MEINQKLIYIVSEKLSENNRFIITSHDISDKLFMPNYRISHIKSDTTQDLTNHISMFMSGTYTDTSVFISNLLENKLIIGNNSGTIRNEMCIDDVSNTHLIKITDIYEQYI